jgi:hypothetical protein
MVFRVVDRTHEHRRDTQPLPNASENRVFRRQTQQTGAVLSILATMVCVLA